METAVSKRFRKTSFTVLGFYFVIFFACMFVYDRVHPTGAAVWVLAALPVLPIIGVIGLMGRYLRDEPDEFKRDLTVRCLLWGCAGIVAESMFGGFLWIFGWKGQLPPFLGFWVFFAFMMAARLFYKLQNKVPVEV
jgi:hypothetical protein